MQKQSENIQNSIMVSFQKTHSEQVYIKEEKVYDGSSSSLRLKCHKCKKKFSTLKDMANHKHADETVLQSRRFYAKSIIDSSKISKDFKENVSKHGVKYDYNAFTRAFFSENEKDSFMRPRRLRSELKQGPKEPEVQEENISEDFMKLVQKNGIDYNMRTFQSAFGYSEHEATAQKTDKRESCQVKTKKPMESAPELIQKPRKNEVSSDFVKTLEENGIQYDLAVFQKAFGYSEPFGDDMKKEQEKSRNDVFKTLKKKGFVNCPNCSCRFTNRSNFLRHMRTHKPRDKDLFCEECAKHFKTPACLQIHEATDHGRNNGPVDCPICFKNYPDRGSLRSHYYIHCTERSFLCGR